MDQKTIEEIKRDINDEINECYKISEELDNDYYLGKAVGLQIAYYLITRREQNG